MSVAANPAIEAIYWRGIARLKERAPKMHNLWVMLGRGRPCSVKELATVLWYPDEPPTSSTLQQQRVGAFLAHINTRVKEWKVIIKPGALRGTYQLYPLDAWQREQERLRADLLAAKANQKPGKAKLVPRRPRAAETKPRQARNKSA
jgi:hypothetical protein